MPLFSHYFLWYVNVIILCPISSTIGCYEEPAGLTCSGSEAPSDSGSGLSVDTRQRPEAVSVGAEAAGAGASLTSVTSSSAAAQR